METITTVSIGLGLVISLIFSEFLGIAAGGMVVPGYIALFLHKPFTIFLTIAVALITYFIINSLGMFSILYGRRRTVVMILTGFILGWIVKSIEVIPYGTDSIDLTVVGYIIPGLIAIWIDRQGIIMTISALLTSSIIVRLVLMLIFGMEISS